MKGNDLDDILYQMTEVLIGLEQVDDIPLLEILKSEESVDIIMEMATGRVC